MSKQTPEHVDNNISHPFVINNNKSVFGVELLFKYRINGIDTQSSYLLLDYNQYLLPILVQPQFLMC